MELSTEYQPKCNFLMPIDVKAPAQCTSIPNLLEFRDSNDIPNTHWMADLTNPYHNN